MCNVEAWMTQRMAKSEGEGVFHMIRNQFNQWAVRQAERYDESDFDEILREYFEVLQSGLKA